MSSEKKYSVYRISNNTPNAKKKTYYIVSSIDDQTHLKAVVRGMATSSTARGGIKALSKDMKAQGKDYKDNFSIVKMKGSMTKHDATIYRNQLKGKAAPAKAYNQPRS